MTLREELQKNIRYDNQNKSIVSFFIGTNGEEKYVLKEFEKKPTKYSEYKNFRNNYVNLVIDDVEFCINNQLV